MPPALPLRRAVFAVCLRPKPTSLSPSWKQTATSRFVSANEKPLPKADTPGPGPNQEQLPHVTEEAAATAKIIGESGPDVEEQGTPVQEVLKRDEKAKENAPQILKKEIEKTSPTGTRSFSTSARRPAELLASRPADLVSDGSQHDLMALLNHSTDIEKEGHIFGLPQLPLAKNMHLRRREDPLIEQTTKLIMQSGKLSKAQNTMNMILERLRTTKPPTYSATRPLLPGSPPASHLPLNPVLYITLAIDSVAPLMRLKSIKGAAGGGVALQIPVSLKQRQRRRMAIMWILDAAEKKRSTGSGRAMFAHKVADEIIAVIEGRSGVWEKRANIHRMATAARANLVTNMRRRR